MFDLFRSRDKAVRALLTAMLVIVALSMVTYLIPQTSTGTETVDNGSVIATVGKDKITSQEVSRQIRSMVQNRQMPSELLSIYVPQMIQQYINERAMQYEAARLGIKVSDAEVDNAIIDTVPAQFIKDGKVDGTILAQVLAQQGMTLSDLRTSVSRQLMLTKLESIVAQGVVVSQKDVEDEYHKKNDKVVVQYAMFPPARYLAEAEPSDAELKTYYDANKSSFKIPEKRSVAVILLDPDKIAAGVHPTDDDLHKAYAANQDHFRTPERVNVRHILVKSDANNDAQAKAKAEGLLKQLQGGADFAKIAKENSDDPGSKEKGGELDWIVKGQTVPEFEKAAFSLKPNEISSLVKTTYGYHILQVHQHEQAQLQPFETVKLQLITDLQKQMANAQLEAMADKAVQELKKDPTKAEAVAQLVGGQYFKGDNLQTGDPVPGVGVSKEFDNAIDSLRQGQVTPGPVGLQGGKVAVAVVTAYSAAHEASFDEARGEVRTKVAEEKLNSILTAKAGEFLEKVKAAGGDIEKVGKEMKLEVKTSGEVDRNGAIEGLGSASSLPEAFQTKPGTLLAPAHVTGGVAVVKLVSKHVAELSDLKPETVNSMRDEIRQQRQRDRAQLFVQGLRQKLEKDGTVKINQKQVDAIVQTYRKG